MLSNFGEDEFNGGKKVQKIMPIRVENVNLKEDLGVPIDFKKLDTAVSLDITQEKQNIIIEKIEKNTDQVSESLNISEKSKSTTGQKKSGRVCPFCGI